MRPDDLLTPAGLRDDDNELVVDGPTSFPLDRRDFVKLTATGLIVLFAIDPADAVQEPVRLPAGRQGYPTDLNAYLHVGANGRVTCLVGKVELGQGAMTSLPQLLAEELDVSLDAVDIVMGDTDLCPWDMGTFGSLSVRQFGPVLRQAAAEARAALLELAAERLQVPIDRLTVSGGTVRAAGGAGKTITYAQLTEGKRIERTLTARPPLKAASAFSVVGQTAPRRDGMDKVTGRAKYAGDIVPPGGALHARVLRPPAHGATLASVDVSAAQKIAGVKVVRDGDMVAVLHRHRDEADAALALIKAEWTRHDPPVDNATIFDYLMKAAPPPQIAAEGGSLDEGATLATVVLDETYLDSYVAHAPIEPHAAVAAVENGKATVWAGTQTPFPLKNQIMQALRLPADKVRVITTYVGGGFGGKSASRQGVEAARLAMLTGTPVRVQWSRDEEFFFDTFRPAAVIKIRSGLNAANEIVLWDYLVYCAGERGAAQFYNIPHHRTVVRGSWGGPGTPGLHPFAVGPWRAPGNNTNAFARESHIDVLAARVRLDPVEFRLKHLVDPRMRRVVEAAAKLFGWTPKPAPSGRGVGVACGIDAGTYVALMAEVAVAKETGHVQVKRVACAQEMGVVVNPGGARQQIEGCLTMGLGYALSEEVQFKGGAVLNRNFDSYELPRFSWVPRIDAVIVSAPEIAAQGGGEPAIVPMGAVIANAIFDATGARLYRLPMTPARVKAAVQKVDRPTQA
ncbi:MAG TPA: molybdopterin cofactor-binding domain-containing protein [Vicinamibacterales bacterium]|nr:molybdopterin cofactor-binding domain-containing protein [Vicinamibacterales bacterium]